MTKLTQKHADNAQAHPHTERRTDSQDRQNLVSNLTNLSLEYNEDGIVPVNELL